MHRVIVGQDDLLHGMLIGLLANGHLLIEGVPGLAKTTAVSCLAGRHPHRLPADPVHAGPAAGGPHRHADLPAAGRPLRRAEGADLRQHHPGRRDQPRARQGAERPAGGDAGAAGHDRRGDLPPRRSVPGAGHAEPDRAGGNLPAARGPGRPVHAQAHRALSQPRGGAGDPRPHGAHARQARDRAGHGAGRDRRRPRGGRRDLHRREDQGLHRRSGLRDARSGTASTPGWRS